MTQNLGEYGVAVFSIGAILYIVKLFVGFMKNHIEHHTSAAKDLKNAVCNLLTYLERKNGGRG